MGIINIQPIKIRGDSVSQIKSVCVYCGSSDNVDQKYKDIAKTVGEEIAKQGLTMVYGGGARGLMGITANAAMEAGGQVKGIITSFLDKIETSHHGLTELTVVESMHERKLKMFDISDAFIVLPGGFGTLDEAFELMTWRQIGLHKKHIVFLNFDKYWEHLLKGLIPHLIKERFAREEDLKMFSIVDDPLEVISALQCPPDDAKNFVSKWA